MKSENSQLVMVGLKNISTAIRNKVDVFLKKKDLIDLKNDFISWKMKTRKSSRKNEQKIKGRK